MGLRRSWARAGLLALLAGALGAIAVGPASASCVGPSLAVSRSGAPSQGPPVLPLLGTVTATGEEFHTGCDDTAGGGCGAPRSEAAMRRVELDLEQGGRSVVLGVADAGSRQENYRIAWHLQLPSGLSPGPAVLRAADVALQVQLQP